MSAHEVFTSLFWIVLGGYVIYVGWLALTWMRSLLPGPVDSGTRPARRDRHASSRTERSGGSSPEATDARSG